MASTTILSLCTYFAFAHFLLLTLKCFGNRRFFLSFHSLFLWLESDVVFVSSIFCLLTDSILYFLISIYHCYQIYKKKTFTWFLFVSFDLTLGNIQVSSVCFPFVSVSTDLFKQNAIHFDQLFYQSIRIEFVMVNWAREFSFAHYVFIGQKCNLILIKNTFISFRIFVHSIVCVAKKNGTGFYITRKKSILYSCLIAYSMHFKYEFYSKRIFESTCI